MQAGVPSAKSQSFAMLLLAAFQIAVFFFVLQQTAVTTPFGDAVQWIEQYTAFRANGDLLHYLILPHNEHRPITIRVLVGLDAEVFGGRGFAFIGAALASVVGIIALVLREMRRDGHLSLSRGAMLAISLVLTVPMAVDCSIPANTIFPLTIFFAMAALVLAMRTHMLTAIALGLLATFTNAGGLAVWPALLWISFTRADWTWCSLLLAITAAVGAIFLLATPHTQRYEAHSLWDLVTYWPSFVGLPWSRLPALQVPAALFGVGVFVAAGALAAHLRRGDDLQAIAIAFVLFSLGCSFMAAIARSGMHEPYPAVRYSIFLLPAHLALLFLVLRRKWLSEPAAIALMAVLVVQQVLSGYMALHTARSIGLPI